MFKVQVAERQVKKPTERFDKLSVNGTVQHRARSSELRRRRARPLQECKQS